MSDHSGAVENPDGLDMEELYRLHIEDLPIDAYDPSKLYGGDLHLVTTTDGTQKRNTMHNRILADVFVPAGGRPNTINALNWKHYLTAEGKPSAPIIVEAANIYTTPEARKLLGDQGVMIVKDSSANKAGVCCSSYEIVASMLLSKEEFMAIKEELVEDVLKRLRHIAKQEAQLLFRESRLNPSVQIPDVAVEISKAITRCGDIFEVLLTENLDVLDVETRRRLVVESLPEKLVEVAGERLDDLPPAYTRAMLCASLASRMVYNEGLDFIESLSDEALRSAAGTYLKSSDSLQRIISEVADSDLPDKSQIMEMLKMAGVKTAMAIR